MIAGGIINSSHESLNVGADITPLVLCEPTKHIICYMNFRIIRDIQPGVQCTLKHVLAETS